ncbi:MAG: thymidine phosphorylase [Armatimonadota bacterium]|nr:thymidine phosphorylase [Armatimonadota bacterium]
MRPLDIIRKKRDGEENSPEEINFFIEAYIRGEVSDFQMAAWLMAVYFRGMSASETAALTMAMVRSGCTLDLSCIPGRKVDKHSTGGVGDKTTIVLVPLLAAVGLPVIKVSGRSLGFTGGTIDKIESVPGFRTELSTQQMVDQVRRIGAVIVAQSENLVPADKKIYALRDLTATVESIPLIAASVMSKKIAAGADAIVLDVKAGLGAFMKTIAEAQQLAQTMVSIGKNVGKETVAVITNMDQPLGRAVGNSLEVKEAIETLKGNGPPDLVELCVRLGSIALVLGRKALTLAEGEKAVHEALCSGSGAAKFKEIIEAQGGNPAVVDDPTLLPKAPVVREIVSPASGYIWQLDAYKVARAEVELGGCRGEVGASPDPTVGIVLHRKVGDKVSAGEVLGEIHAGNERLALTAEEIVLSAYNFNSEPPPPQPIVHEVIA